MNNSTHFEDKASGSRGVHEGESSASLCDRPSRTRDLSQRQLPTDHDYAVSTREYQTDQSSPILPWLPLALSSKNKNYPGDVQRLTGHSISGSHSVREDARGVAMRCRSALQCPVAVARRPMAFSLLRAACASGVRG